MATIGDALASDGLTSALIGTEQASTPTTPASGKRLLYPKADGWYELDDAGTETGPLGAGGGGSGGGVPASVATATAGPTSINTSGAWANLSAHVAAFSDRVVAASAGDVLAVTLSGLWDNQATSASLDVATIVGGTITNYVTGGGSTPAGSGFRPWIGLPASQYVPFFGTCYYTVQAGDIDTGNVTLRARVKTSGVRNLYHDPGQFVVVNLG